MNSMNELHDQMPDRLPDMNKVANETDPKTMAYVMMLDVSGSMHNWLTRVKIYAKAFVRQTRVKDQFGINVFSDNAWWIYPQGTDPDIVTVSQEGSETNDATKEIEKIKLFNWTNMGAAIKLANKMIEKSSADIRAFVLLSDGVHNVGTPPENELGVTPPIYIAGLGQEMRESYFTKLKNKNSKSKFYNISNAYEMMKVFNQILADSSESNLSCNEVHLFTEGSDYIIQPFTLSTDGGSGKVVFGWDDPNFRYTTEMPHDYLVNIHLITPDDKTLDITPDISDPGLCVFRLNKYKAGIWKAVIEYNTKQSADCTISVVEENTTLSTEVKLPLNIEVGTEIPIDVSIFDKGVKLTNCEVTANIYSPKNKVQNTYQSAEVDGISTPLFVEMKKDSLDFLPANDGMFRAKYNDTSVPGVYNIEFCIQGNRLNSSEMFTTIKRHSIYVGEK